MYGFLPEGKRRCCLRTSLLFPVCYWQILPWILYSSVGQQPTAKTSQSFLTGFQSNQTNKINVREHESILKSIFVDIVPENFVKKIEESPTI